MSQDKNTKEHADLAKFWEWMQHVTPKGYVEDQLKMISGLLCQHDEYKSDPLLMNISDALYGCSLILEENESKKRAR